MLFMKRKVKLELIRSIDQFVDEKYKFFFQIIVYGRVVICFVGSPAPFNHLIITGLTCEALS